MDSIDPKIYVRRWEVRKKRKLISRGLSLAVHQLVIPFLEKSEESRLYNSPFDYVTGLLIDTY
jgi:hypothetical protein